MLIPFRYNLRSLRIRWVTTLVTAVSVGLSVTVFVAVMALAEGLREVFVSTGEPLNLLVIRQGSQTETNSIIERSRTEVISTLPNIATDATGRAAGFGRAGGIHQPAAAHVGIVQCGDPRHVRAGAGDAARRCNWCRDAGFVRG